MKKLAAAMAALIVLSACTATEKGATIGAVSGGLIGNAIGGNSRGTLIGAGVGAVAGALIGRASEPGKCRYRDRRGRVYIDDC